MSNLPDSARTVIIGGGIIGCSVAYHLAKLGRSDIIVLERSKLTSGTTWHAAGLVRRLRPSATLTNLINYSIELYNQLEAETGQSCGWNQTGSLSIASNRDRLTHLSRAVSLGRAFGLEAELVDSKRIKELWPLINETDLIGGVFSPADGRVNPSDTALALSKGARINGVRFIEDTRVTGFEKKTGRIATVITDQGRIDCEEVVIACGLWSREVADMAGAHMPLYACEHFYALTKPIDEISGHMPTLGDQDNYLYTRDEVGGLLFGFFEPGAKPLPLNKLPENFSFDLLDEDWEHVSDMLALAIHRIPALETAEIKMLLNGPESFTLDSQFMLGESPEVPGLFLIGGMNSTGIALAGGVGKALSEWMIAGEPTMDLLEADIRRFTPQQNVLTALHERIPEVLGKHYEITYPGTQMQTARGQLRSPIHTGLIAAGAHFASRGGWERPEFFDKSDIPQPMQLTWGVPPWRKQVCKEYKAARERVIIYDQSPYGKLLIEGVDAESFLNRICANHMSVNPGRIVYSQVLNTRGGVESDVTVQRHSVNRYLMVTGQAELVRVKSWLEKHKKAARIAIVDMTHAMAIISIAGPESTALLQATSMSALPDLKRFGFKQIETGYARVTAGRLSYTGEPGYELYIDSGSAPGVHEALVAAGKAFGLQHAGMLAVAALRIESGHRAWGHELTPGTTALESGMTSFIALDKDVDFIGKSALSRQSVLQKRCASMVFDDENAIPVHDEPVFYQGELAGQISSSAFSPGLNRSVALAMLKLPQDTLQSRDIVDGFEVEIAGVRQAARASLKPIKQVFKDDYINPHFSPGRRL